SNDSYTFGHCERVATLALAAAQELGLDQHTQTTIRLGAYLHDVGKVRVQHEVLNKPGPLTHAEREAMQMHPIWGVELLLGVGFPWDFRPIIRWHHEKHDGTGRSEEHTSELQSRVDLVCRLLLEKKNKTHTPVNQPRRHPRLPTPANTQPRNQTSDASTVATRAVRLFSLQPQCRRQSHETALH